MKEITRTLRKKGYKILSQLGNNHLGGRITYKAVRTPTNRPVVIKYFRWLGASSWSGYNAIEREIETLKALDHPNIPKYIDSFECDGDLFVVTEYIEAPNTSGQSFTPQQVLSIAIALLEILEYLHSFNPPILHRDIKPENILVDKDLKVYLVDFGLAKASRGETAASTTVAGTLGFMAPEAMLGKSCQASDLYSLGITLVCWLYNISSSEISDYIHPDFSVNWQQLPSPSSIPPDLIGWLKKLTQPSLQSRVSTAQETILLYFDNRELRITRNSNIKAIAIGLSVAAVVGVGVFGRQILIPPINHVEKSHDLTSSKPVINPKPQSKIQPEESKPPIIFSDRSKETRPLMNQFKTFMIVVLIIGVFWYLGYVAFRVGYHKQPISVVLESGIGLISAMFAGAVVVILFL